MTQDALFHRYRAASRRALMVSVVVFLVLASSLAWYGGELEEVEASIAELRKKLGDLERERERLTEELRALKDAPDGGVRAIVRPVEGIDSEKYDFALWVDTSALSGQVAEVRYEFESTEYEPMTSRLEEAGFIVSFRGPVRPEQPLCPGRCDVTIVFEDAPDKSFSYDLCAGISGPETV